MIPWPRGGRLLKLGLPVKLQPQAMRLLVARVERQSIKSCVVQTFQMRSLATRESRLNRNETREAL